VELNVIAQSLICKSFVRRRFASHGHGRRATFTMSCHLLLIQLTSRVRLPHIQWAYASGRLTTANDALRQHLYAKG
jgi:hypothetical protein